MADNGEKHEKSLRSEPDKKSSTTKGKAPAKKTIASPETPKNDLNNDLILECLKSIQQSQTDLVSRIEAIEKASTEHYDYQYDESYDEAGPSRLEKRGFEPDEDSSVKDSKFASLAKKFKPNENCSENIDECLANNVTDLYRKGMDDEIYEKTER